MFDMRDDRDGGYGTLFHREVLKPGEPDDELWTFPELRDDPARMPPTYGADQHGSPYAPFFVPHWFKHDATSLTIFYALSTWRPYQTTLMRTTLDIECEMPP